MEFLCFQFLHSDWRDWRGSGYREDRLDKPEWLQRFLEGWGLQAPVPPDPDSRRALAELRDHMRAVVQAIVAGRPPEAADLEAVNRALEYAVTHPHLVAEGEGFRLEQVTPGGDGTWTHVMGAIAASFADVLAHKELRRIRICANDDCRWVYYDESRNRTSRWCDEKACGNLWKVRRFRERQKAKEAEGS